MHDVTPYILSLIAVTVLIAGTGSILLHREESRYKQLVKAHQDLAARALLLESLAESADEGVPHAVISVDSRGLICGLNSTAAELFGYLAEELRGHSIFEVIPVDGEPHRFSRESGGKAERRVDAIHQDGTPVPVWMRVSRTSVNDQERFRFVFDDEESRADRRRLQAENQTLRTALDSSGRAVALLTAQGRVTRLSRTCADLLEISTKHAGGHLFWELFHREPDWSLARSAFEQALGGVPSTLSKTVWISRTQKVVRLDWVTLSPAFNVSGELEHVVLIGAPEAAAVSESEQQSNLKAMGQLVGRAAGHFEDLLSTINGYSELVLHEMAAANPLRRDVEQILTASQTASRTVQQLLTFSGNRLILLEPLDLNALLVRLNGRLQADLTLGHGTCRVLGNREAFEDVLATLAEYTAGKLAIATEMTRVHEIRSTIADDLEPGVYVSLRVSLGRTLDADLFEHLFEPFHPSAHAPGQSPTGMAMVLGTIRSCGGGISLPERGGKILEIFLPVAIEGRDDERQAPLRAATARV